MDAAWQTSIDRTLRNTEATLENLQQRRRTYDRAKLKVDDYLGPATPHRDSRGLDSLERTDISVPPPLPQHRRYRTSHEEATLQDNGLYTTAATGPSSSFSVNPPAFLPPSQHNTGGRRTGGSSSGLAARDDPTAPLQLVNAQVRGAMLELELEKAKRADSIRELAYRTTAELAELRSMITQVQNENVLLKKSVRALEGKLGYASDAKYTSQLSAGGAANTTNSEAPAHASSRKALLASAVANSGFGLPHDGSTTAAAASTASLLARVEVLESGLTRQQHLADDRQARTAAMLREMVKAEVGADMAEVRTAAREAARDSTEELLKLRLSAMQSSVQTDVQRALRTAAASETAAQLAQQQCSEAERRLSAQMQKMNVQLLEWQRGAVSPAPQSSGSGGAAFAAQASQERVLHLERRVEEQVQELRGQVRQLRLDTEAHVERVAQQQKQAQSQLQAKANLDDMRTIVDRLDEQQRSGGVVSRDQVNTIVRAQLQPVQDSLQKVQEAAQAQQENAEAWRRQTGLRFAAVEAATKDFRDEAERQDQQWAACKEDVRQARAEAAAAQARVTDAVRQCKAETMALAEEKLTAVEERVASGLRERQQQWEAQLRSLQQSAAEQQEVLQRAKGVSDAAEERLRRVEGAVATMESSVPHSLADVKARCEAVQSALQQTCAVPLTRVQQDVETLQRRLVSLDEDKTRAAAVSAQQLTDAKHFFEEHVRNARDVLEQRVAHQKEMYEELRSQQSAQRRSVEEQQQLFMEQLMRLQQQQQQQYAQLHSLSTPVPASAPAKKRSVSEGGAAAGDEMTHQDNRGSTPAVSLETFQELQQQVSNLVPQLQAVESRVEAAERAAAKVPSLISDATHPLQDRLTELHDTTQQELKDQQLRISEVERQLPEHVRHVTEVCEKTSAATQAELVRLRDSTTAALSPLHMATQLAADPDSLQHLAHHLQDRLATPESTARTLSELQARLEQHTDAIDDLRNAVLETQQQLAERLAQEAAVSEEKGAVPPPPLMHDAEEENREENALAKDLVDFQDSTQTALQELRLTCASMQQRQDTQEEHTRHLSEEKLAAVTAAVEGIRQATASLPQSVQQLSDQYTTLQATQRQQLPTLQKYVQEVLDVMQESQSALLEPLQLKLRAVEERAKTAQAQTEEWMESQTAAAEQRTQSQQRKLEQLQATWEARTTERFDAVQETLAATGASLADVADRVSSVEGKQEAGDLERRELRDQLSLLGEKVEAVHSLAASAAAAAATAASAEKFTSDDVSTPTKALPSSENQSYPKTAEEATAAVSTTSAVVATTTANAEEEPASATVARLQSYIDELEERLTQLEEQTNDSVTATADALGAFGAQLQDVVVRFAATVHHGGSESRADMTIKSLEDVFSYLLQQLQQLQQALYKLQANTVETLEILEQHEESAAALPVLQHTVDAIAAALVPLAERLGVDATSFDFQADTPSHRHQHHLDVYPPSYGDSSTSSVNNTREEASVL